MPSASASQLHQLRGGVGRGAVASVCVLLYTTPLSDTAKSRLKAMIETTDGFEIARRDLEIRGPGEFFGARQSGAPLLRFADLAEDEPLLRGSPARRRSAARAAPAGRRAPHRALAGLEDGLPQGLNASGGRRRPKRQLPVPWPALTR